MLIISAVLAISLVACGKKANTSTGSAQNTARGGSERKVETPKAASAPASAKSDSVSAQSGDGTVNVDRKVIYNASVSLDVKDVGKAYDSAISKAKEMGGYIAQSSVYGSYSTISVKIPAGKMTEYLSFIDTLGGSRKEQDIKMEDVTEQYTDAQARLNNYKAQEEQLLSIMKKAGTIDEIMKVQNEISRVRGEIEVLQGRINLWNNLIDMCTITITLNKVADIGGKDVSITYITWNEIAKAMTNGFKSTLNFVTRFITGIFIVIISVLPLVPFIAVIIWLVLRYRKKHVMKDIEKK